MGFLTDQPQPELSTQRVPGGRRGAIGVVLAAVAVVALLVWKPWESGAPAASPGITAHPVAALPSPTAVPTSTPTLDLPFPPATTAPTGDAPSPQIFEADGNLGSVVFYTDTGPTVHCIYRSNSKSGQSTLQTLIVEPPVVMADPQSAASRIRWHVELESNTEDKLFESEWVPVAASRSRRATLKPDAALTFDAVSITVPAAAGTTTYRATIMLEWIDSKSHVLATQQVHPTIYGPLGDANFPLGPSGCAAAV